MSENKLPVEFKEKWLNALRSGTFRQGKGFLCQISDQPGVSAKFCCLGVAELISGATMEEMVDIRAELPVQLSNPKSPALLLDKDNNFCLSEELGSVHLAGYLAEMNDDGNSFSDIADWIEKHL